MKNDDKMLPVETCRPFTDRTAWQPADYETGQHEPPVWSIIALAVMALFLVWYVWGGA